MSRRCTRMEEQDREYHHTNLAQGSERCAYLSMRCKCAMRHHCLKRIMSCHDAEGRSPSPQALALMTVWLPWRRGCLYEVL